MVMKNLICLLMSAALLASCTEKINDIPIESSQNNTIQICLSANLEPSKTLVGEDGKVLWLEGDEIADFDGEELRRFALTSGAGSKRRL